MDLYVLVYHYFWQCVLFAAVVTPPYALQYKQNRGSLPWDTLVAAMPHGGQITISAPWLSLLPAGAEGSLYEWGRYLGYTIALCYHSTLLP